MFSHRNWEVYRGQIVQFMLCGLLLVTVGCQADQPTDSPPAPLPEHAADYEKNPYPWGFIDSTGEIVIRPRFDEVRPFSDGLALVRENGRWGYVERTGKIAIPTDFRAAWPFVAGLARAQTDEGNFGFIDKQGDWKIPASFAALSEFSEGFAAFRKGDNFGYIGTDGTEKIPAQFTKAGPFKNGYAVVEIEGKYGLIDIDGETIIDFQYARLKPLKGGMARAKEGDLYGYLGTSGDWKISPKFRQATDFEAGVAAVAEVNLWGLIDIDANWILEPQYDQLFYAGEQSWIAASGEYYYLLSATGEQLTRAPFAEIQPFTMGLAPYRSAELWHYLRPDGTVLGVPEYYLAWPFNDGLARVATRYGLTFINERGQQLFTPNPQFFELRDFSEGLAPVEIY